MAAEIEETHPESIDVERARRSAARQDVLVIALHRDHPLRMPSMHVLKDVDVVTVGRGDGDGVTARLEARALHLAIADARLSSAHFRVERSAGGWKLVDLGSTNGTHVNGTVHQVGEIGDGDLVQAGGTAFVFRESDRSSSRDGLVEIERGAELASFEPATQALLIATQQLAKSRVALLVRGETGTGKELLAQAVHRLSGRSGAFVPINCAAIPATLLESELFGHRKGAFSGAIADRVGLVQAAHKGTLFLDEIGDLPLPAQGALLRVLQERAVVPVGATSPVPVDFRLVAATHRPLAEMVGRGEFREDLLARVAGTTLRLPSLRERREDIGLIVRNLFVRAELAPDAVPRFSASAVRALFTYAWPRNVRELEAALESALALKVSDRIDIEHLPEVVRASLDGLVEKAALTPEDLARAAELTALLAEHNGNISAVARATGKARMQIQRWIKRYGLKT